MVFAGRELVAIKSFAECLRWVHKEIVGFKKDGVASQGG